LPSLAFAWPVPVAGRRAQDDMNGQGSSRFVNPEIGAEIERQAIGSRSRLERAADRRSIPLADIRSHGPLGAGAAMAAAQYADFAALFLAADPRLSSRPLVVVLS